MSEIKNKYDNICVLSELTELLNIREFIQEQAISFGFTEEEAFKISLAVDEACSNLIRYAYKFDTTRPICIKIETERNKFIVNILDSGSPFNPLEVPDTDMKEYFRTYKHGGLGIQIMRKVMDEILYIPSNTKNSYNTLMLMKSLV